jgi:hypothetical protein
VIAEILATCPARAAARSETGEFQHMGITNEQQRLLKGNSPLRSGSAMVRLHAPSVEPLAVKPAVAAAMLGQSRSSVYRFINSGQLDAVKSGASTLVLVESIRRYIANLPSFGRLAT